jgi:hypothetical protein
MRFSPFFSGLVAPEAADRPEQRFPRAIPQVKLRLSCHDCVLDPRVTLRCSSDGMPEEAAEK